MADITGGQEIMSVAMALACVRPHGQLQYLKAVRDWKGDPLRPGKLTPMLIVPELVLPATE